MGGSWASEFGPRKAVTLLLAKPRRPQRKRSLRKWAGRTWDSRRFAWVSGGPPQKQTDWKQTISGNGLQVEDTYPYFEQSLRLSTPLQKETRNSRIGQDPKRFVPENLNAAACLVSGPPGIGKTTTCALVARCSRYNVMEFNASDARSSAKREAKRKPSRVGKSRFWTYLPFFLHKFGKKAGVTRPTAALAAVGLTSCM